MNAVFHYIPMFWNLDQAFQIFFAEKMWVAFAVQKLLTFFQQKISEMLDLDFKTEILSRRTERASQFFRRGGSNEYPQSIFWAEIRKIMYTPENPVLLYKSGV